MDMKLLVIAAIGAIVGVAVGFFGYSLQPYHVYSFVVWLTEFAKDAALWAAMGAAVAAGLSYVLRSR